MKQILRSILAMVCILASLNALGSTTTLGKQLETYGIKVANQKYDGFPPTATEVKSASSYVIAYAKAAQADGSLQAAESSLLKNKTKFIGSQPDSATIYNNLKSQGWKGTLQEVQGMTEQSDVAARTALVNKIASKGLYSYLTNDVAGFLASMETQLAISSRKARFLNTNLNVASLMQVMSKADCSTGNGVGLAILAIGSVAAVIPGTELLGGVLIAAGAITMFCVWFACD